jgi:hypothetical protein
MAQPCGRANEKHDTAGWLRQPAVSCFSLGSHKPISLAQFAIRECDDGECPISHKYSKSAMAARLNLSPRAAV